MRSSAIVDSLIKKAESRMKNAERLKLRGDQYLKEGKLSHADGCFRKAERNIAFATDALRAVAAWSPRELVIG